MMKNFKTPFKGTRFIFSRKVSEPMLKFIFTTHFKEKYCTSGFEGCGIGDSDFRVNQSDS